MGERAVARAWARKEARVVWVGWGVVEVVRWGGRRFRGWRGERRRRGRRVMCEGEVVAYFVCWRILLQP